MHARASCRQHVRVPQHAAGHRQLLVGQPVQRLQQRLLRQEKSFQKASMCTCHSTPPATNSCLSLSPCSACSSDSRSSFGMQASKACARRTARPLGPTAACRIMTCIACINDTCGREMLTEKPEEIAAAHARATGRRPTAACRLCHAAPAAATPAAVEATVRRAVGFASNTERQRQLLVGHAMQRLQQRSGCSESRMRPVVSFLSGRLL